MKIDNEYFYYSLILILTKNMKHWINNLKFLFPLEKNINNVNLHEEIVLVLISIV